MAHLAMWVATFLPLAVMVVFALLLWWLLRRDKLRGPRNRWRFRER